jgi:hypothetical protein
MYHYDRRRALWRRGLGIRTSILNVFWMPLTSEAVIDGNGETSGFRGWCPSPLAVPYMPRKKHAPNDRHALQVVMLQHQQQFHLTVRESAVK